MITDEVVVGGGVCNNNKNEDISPNVNNIINDNC